MRQLLIKFLALITLLVSSALHAEPVVTSGSAGSYFGVQVGASKVDGSSQHLPNSLGVPVLVQPSKNGFGTRLFWGYQFSKYLAFENGWAYYSAATYNIPNGNSPQIRIQALDFVGKAIMPLWWGFDVYGKGGAAIVFYNQGGLLAPSSTGAQSGASGITMRPELGAGISYSFTPNWTVDVSATRIMKGGQVPNSDLYTIGLAYHAVDLYCGQFLC